MFLSRRAMSSWSRLVRFIPESSESVLIGEPIDSSLDVGLAAYKGQPIEVKVFEGESILSPGNQTARIEKVKTLLSPVSEQETGAIRCIGLNYMSHAIETKLRVPKVPIMFMKPATALTGPYPAKVVIPKFVQKEEAADYESELAIIIGKDCKDVSEENALDYVLGYTATNDISSRLQQFAQSQFCFSKGYDTACPAGPCVVSAKSCPDPAKLVMKGIKNGTVVQNTGIDDLIFDVPKLVSFLSQGTTLKAGALILTGTPSGVGYFNDVKNVLKDGDEFIVEISGGIGSLVNKIEFEK